MDDIEADVDDVVLSDFAVAGLYRVGGAGDGTAVNGSIISAEASFVVPPRGGRAAPGATRTQRTWQVTLRSADRGAKEDDVVGGVVDGGVWLLRQGDTWEVPGSVVQRPDLESVTVVIGKVRGQSSGVWIAEGTVS